MPSFVEKTEYVCALIPYFSFPVVPNLKKIKKDYFLFLFDCELCSCSPKHSFVVVLVVVLVFLVKPLVKICHSVVKASPTTPPQDTFDWT